MTQNNIYTIIVIVIIFQLTISCAAVRTSEKKTSVYSFTADTLTLSKSKELIDKTPTYELYFDLMDNAQCIDITVIAQDRNGKRVRCAFILESLVDMSRFQKKPLQPVYTELAKNYDINWRFQSNIQFCNDNNDPLKRLIKGNYRLKLSAFTNNFYTFTVDIKSQVPVEFRK